MKTLHTLFSIVRGRSAILFLLAACLLLTGAKPSKRSRKGDTYEPPPEQVVEGTIKCSPADFVKQRRTEPKFNGAFEVGLYFITFPDTEDINPEENLKRQTEGVTDYFKKYTQGLCWPTFKVLGKPFRAPHPLGHYTRWHVHNNKIGWNNEAEGRSRLNELRKAAVASLGVSKMPPVTAMIYANKRKSLESLQKIKVLRDIYPKARTNSWGGSYPDQLGFYNPSSTIRWADPLWPNSAVLMSENSGAGTFIHELGHVLGAPDFYHSTEITGGIHGTPVTVGGGPTGPLYCRWKHCGTLPEDAYQMITKNTTVTLAPRWNTFNEGDPNPLGIFIPTAHPNYLLHLEFEPGSTQQLRGSSESEYGRYTSPNSVDGGIYIYYINITQGSSYTGHPDLCYVYRPNDPTMRGYVGGVAVFREGDAFDENSDPKNILPNQLPTGVEITFGEQTLEGATVSIKLPNARQKATGMTLKRSLLPIIEMKEITEIQPTTVLVETDLTFRGEPLAIERGVVYGSSPHPALPRAKSVQIQGQGFEKARIIDLRPGSTVYVRAYAKSELGVSYSKEEQRILLPRTEPEMDVAPLLIDHYSAGSDWLTKNFNFRTVNNAHANATPQIALLKLMAYRRATLDGKKPKKNDPFDLNKLHLNPHEGRFPPTMTDTLKARDAAEKLAYDLGLIGTTIPEDLEKRIIKTLKFPSRPRKGKETVVKLEEGSEDTHIERIRETLLRGWPVLCVRQSALVSSPVYALDVCIIDGIRQDPEEGLQLHIVYPSGIDRLPKTGRKTGWHAPTVLTNGITETGARLLYLDRSTSPF